MTEEKKPFTVTDRRLFTTDGERRAQAEPELPEREVFRPGPMTPTGPPGSSPARLPPVDFAGFLLNLGAQAGVLLGGGAEPADLDGARDVISVLEMLRDKTFGRRTPQEDEILDGLLYELRMAYLQKAGGTKA
jgi:hypothetical protein